MVVNVPTPEDFYTSGKELLNFAWDATATLLVELDNADFYGIEESDMAEVSTKYWAASKRTLTTALTVIQQAVELVIKGRIAEVSPYLLISDAPARWPSPYEAQPVDFERFRTIDAQDLVKVHDTFAPAQFEPKFIEKLRHLREIRNIVMHSVGKNVSVQVAEVVESALFMHKSLFPGERWFSVRREFLRGGPYAALGAAQYATNNACREANIVKRLLLPRQVETYLGVDKKQRAYFCPVCLDDADTDAEVLPVLAVLRPNNREAAEVYCPVCNDVCPIERAEHRQSGCEGNLVSAETGQCLVCAGWHHDGDDSSDSHA
ncbi:hypothetical protein [Paraburkholderia phenoliruptrix]|uniref:hypothetical protein n=1 Tax=Paraburkholderia phenoliruptrix TaxID=252970 RepID=UPI0039B42F1E